MAYEIDLQDAGSDGIPRMSVREDSTLLFEGVLPPYIENEGDAVALPKVDLDVVWTMSHCTLSEVTWVQHLRDGIERRGRHGPCQNRLDLAVPYSLMIEICYGGLPFDEVLEPSILMTFIGQLSCLTGLLHGEGAARLGSLDQRVVDALVAWSSGEANERIR